MTPTRLLPLVLVAALLVAVGSAVPARGQDGSAAPNAPDAPDAERERKLAEARARWDAMSPEEREAALARYKQLQALPEDQREKALDNYRKLLQAQRGETPAPAPEAAPPRERVEELGPQIERFAHDDLFRRRLRQLHDEMGGLLHDDPGLMRRLMSLPEAERRKWLSELRREAIRLRTLEMLQAAGVDEARAAELIAALEEARREEDRLVREHIDKNQQLHREAVERISNEFGANLGRAADRILHALRDGGHDRWRRGHDDRDHRDHRGPRGEPPPALPPWPEFEALLRDAGVDDEGLAAFRAELERLRQRLPPPPSREGRDGRDEMRDRMAHEMVRRAIGQLLLRHVTDDDARRRVFDRLFPAPPDRRGPGSDDRRGPGSDDRRFGPGGDRGPGGDDRRGPDDRRFGPGGDRGPDDRRGEPDRRRFDR